MPVAKTLHVWHENEHWKLEMDPNEVYTNDPGMGTPLLVIAPNGSTATLACALGEGETDCGGDNCVQIPNSVMTWLDKIQCEAEAYVYGSASGYDLDKCMVCKSRPVSEELRSQGILSCEECA